MLLNTRVLSVFFVLAGYFIQGQSLSFTHYTVADGLASNETYDIIQDKRGYLIIATDHGIQQFDGKTFKNLHFHDERLNGLTTFKIFTDDHQRVWISTYRNGIFFIRNDTLWPYRYNARILDIAGKSFLDQFYVEPDGSVAFSVFHLSSDIFRIQPDGSVRSISPGMQPERTEGYAKYIYSCCDNLAIAKRVSNSGDKAGSSIPPHYRGFLSEVIPGNRRLSIRGGPVLYAEEELWAGVGNYVHCYSGTGEPKRSFPFQSEILGISRDVQKNILVATREGAYYIDGKTLKIKALLEGHPVNTVYQDSEGGYWMASVDNGIWYFPSLLFRQMDISGIRNAKINCMDSYGDHIAVATSDGNIFLLRFSEEILQLERKFASSDAAPPKEILVTRDFILAQGNFISHTTGLPTIENTTVPHKPRNIFDTYQAPDQTITTITHNGIFFSPENTPAFTEVLDTSVFFTSVCHINGEIYLGFDKGLLRYSMQDRRLAELFPDQIREWVTDILPWSHQRLIVSTKTNGLFLMEKGKAIHITPENGLLNSNCSRIAIENDSVFWAGSNNGLYRIQTGHGGISCESFNYSSGLKHKKVNDLALAGGYLFIATDNGVTYTELPHSLPSRHPLKIELSKFHPDDTELKVRDTLVLSPGQRNLLLKVKTLSFKYPDNLYYSYQLRGHDEDKIISKGNTLLYSNIEPGAYDLEVNVATPDKYWNPEAQHFTVIVPAFFYEEKWFRITSYILAFFLLLGSVFQFVKTLARKKERAIDYARAQFQALSLQLNPHFIFNSLNNIQYLALSRDHFYINRFISDLSSLTRNTLEHSRLQLITLEKEIGNMQLYLELEAMRFDDKPVQSILEIDPELSIDHELIPPILLQPVVENSLWHGLLGKEGERVLHIAFSRIPNGYTITIADNGIGLKASASKKTATEGKTSVGIQNIRSRIHLYNQMNFGKAEFTLDEAYPGAPMPGTRAHFTFYPNYKKHHSYDAQDNNNR